MRLQRLSQTANQKRNGRIQHKHRRVHKEIFIQMSLLSRLGGSIAINVAGIDCIHLDRLQSIIHERCFDTDS